MLTSSLRVLLVCCVLLTVASLSSGRAQFNLFPTNWNSGTGNNVLYPPAVEEGNGPQNSRCSTLLDIGTHGSRDCPRDFDHQIFDTHSCQFVCLSDINQMSSLYDQNGIAAGDKPRRGLP